MTLRYRRRHPHSGFTLIEVVVVLLIFSVIIAMAAAITRGIAASQKRSLTVTRLALMDAALVQFVMQTKRLPCPADGTRLSTDADAGQEAARTDAAGCTDTTMQHGVVPWRTLGLTEGDATDAWDRRLTYRLQPALAGQAAMDMSWCDPASTQLASGTALTCIPTCAASALANCTPPAAFLRGKGLEVRNVAGTVVMQPTPPVNTDPPTGAAYVVISHGETGGGGYLSSGKIASSEVDGTAEARNYADKRYPADTAYFIDDTINENPGDAFPGPHFDDIVSRPGLMAVITKAGLGPRSH